MLNDIQAYGDWGIYTSSAKTSGLLDILRLIINPTGDMGLGTTTPDNTATYTTLSVGGSTGGMLTFQNGTTSKGKIYNTATDFVVTTVGTLYLGSNTSTQVTITSSAMTVTPALVVSTSLQVGGGTVITKLELV